MLDVQRYNTPAHFNLSSDGRSLVHSPTDSGMQIITPASTTLSTFTEQNLEDAFLETDKEEFYVDDLPKFLA